LIDEKNIWQFKQNKPTLIVKDIKEKYPEIDEDFIYHVLLKRGVFKWLAVRRDLIKLKSLWLGMIPELIKCKKHYKYWNEFRDYSEAKGYQKCLEKCIKEIRKLCHSDRFRSPDFDRGANRYLERVKNGL
jgi:hypothetical protein